MKQRIVAASVLLVLAMLVVVWQVNRLPRPVVITPTLTGQEEYCLSCHADLPEISASHPIESFGCVLCHGGERLALEADLAHSTMRGGRNPSDLAVAEISCGGSECHTGSPELHRDHVARVQTSLQATYAGAIASIRYTYGAQADLTAQKAISAVQALHPPEGASDSRPQALDAFNPAKETHPFVQAFGENCLTCHLQAEPLPGAAYNRLTGCAACHTPSTGRDPEQPLHQLTTVIPYTQCNACHNRGNYDLRQMNFVPRSDSSSDRMHDYYQPIAQFTRCEFELDCVDCHTRQEAMGNGYLYNNQAEQQYVQCKTCHGTLDAAPLTRTIQDETDIALRLAYLNPDIPLQVGDTIVVTEQDEPLWNLRQLPDGSFEMITKVTQVRYPVPLVMGSVCTQNPEQQESNYCHACHAVQR
jgi:hypothetical protein